MSDPRTMPLRFKGILLLFSAVICPICAAALSLIGIQYTMNVKALDLPEFLQLVLIFGIAAAVCYGPYIYRGYGLLTRSGPLSLVKAAIFAGIGAFLIPVVMIPLVYFGNQVLSSIGLTSPSPAFKVALEYVGIAIQLGIISGPLLAIVFGAILRSLDPRWRPAEQSAPAD